MEEVEPRREQRPRATQDAKAELLPESPTANHPTVLWLVGKLEKLVAGQA